MDNDDRDYYRMMTTERLLTVARDDGVTVEMAVVLAERLAQDYYAVGYGNFQPRSN